MAKPIRATPELKGSEAALFIKKMLRTESSRMTKKEVLLAKDIEKLSI
jgi:hypothetical protein